MWFVLWVWIVIARSVRFGQVNYWNVPCRCGEKWNLQPSLAHAGALFPSVAVMLQWERPLHTIHSSEPIWSRDSAPLLQPSCASAARWRWPASRDNTMGNLSSCLTAGWSLYLSSPSPLACEHAFG